MCCFSGPVEDVSNTGIFVRLQGGNQYIVYSMEYRTRDDVAMILPIPTVLDCPENSVEFVDLSDYDNFFRDMKAGFPEPVNRSKSMPMMGGLIGCAARSTLKVHQVGKFEASFVPKRKDFARLDKRFQLPISVWRDLGSYKDYGFVVCKLRKSYGDDKQKIHPIAFKFPTRDADKLYFPTVHVHDGTVKPRSEFDHDLYYQPTSERDYKTFDHNGWTESTSHAKRFMLTNKTKDIVLASRPCFKKKMHGTFDNVDVTVSRDLATVGGD